MAMRKNLASQTFSRLTVIGLHESRKGRLFWKCSCVCGNEKVVAAHELVSGKTKSCGCLRHTDLTGLTFGNLTVIKKSHVENQRVHWLCECNCGNKVIVAGGNLTTGNSTGCKRCRNKGSRKPYGEAAFNSLLRTYKDNARHRDLEFSLSTDEFRKLTSLNCFYCGKPPSTIKFRPNTNGTYTYNGIDRLDSSVGYITENVVPCCEECNRAKMNTPYEEFREWVMRVADYMSAKSISAQKGNALRNQK